MMIVNLAQAKAHLSELVEAAVRGKVVVIARRNVPLVKLQPVQARRSWPRFGVLHGKVHLSADFDAPLGHSWPFRK